MYYRLPVPIAIPLQRVADFHAADPWNGNAVVEWTLRVFRMTDQNNRGLYTQYSREKQMETATGHNLDRDDVLGIVSSADGLFHILPVALVRLWQRGEVPNTALPQLIAQFENGLVRRDFHDPALGRSWRRNLVYGIAVVGTLFFLFGIYRYFALRNAPYGGGEFGLVFWGLLALIYWVLAAVMLLWMGRRERRVRSLETNMAAALSAAVNRSTQRNTA